MGKDIRRKHDQCGSLIRRQEKDILREKTKKAKKNQSRVELLQFEINFSSAKSDHRADFKTRIKYFKSWPWEKGHFNFDFTLKATNAKESKYMHAAANS